LNKHKDFKEPKIGTVLPVLVLASSVSIMSTDMYTPSLPHLPDFFGTSPEMVQLTVSLNIFAFGISQLIYGPLSDRFGRRPILLAGIAGFVISSAFCGAAQSIGQLIGARVFQGMLAAVEMVLALAIIRDLYDETGQVRALAIYGMALAVAPGLAPIAGGYIHVFLGWRVIFLITALIGFCVTLLIWRLLPETVTPDKQALNLSHVLQDYLKLLTNSTFLNYTLMVGAGFGVIFAFATAGPFILIKYFNVPTHFFGFYQAAVVLSWFTGSVVTNQIADKIDSKIILQVGLVCAAIGALFLPVLVFTGLEGPLNMTLAISILGFGMGPVFAVAPLRALAVADTQTGTASAMVSTVEMVIGGLASAGVGVFHDGTTRPLAITILALLVIAGVAYWLSFRKSQQKIETTGF